MKQQKSPQEKLGLTELIAIGVGGMIGGGIFSVLGLAVNISGHAAPVAFAIGSMIAFVAGHSYVRLALTFRGDGASYTYLRHAFPSFPWIAGSTGWIVIAGYVGTLALYAFTFGAYGADLLGSPRNPDVRMVLSAAVLLFFMLVNLKGVRSSGITEDLVVYSKIILLGLFAIIGLSSVRHDYLIPVFDRGIPPAFMAGALIFVAYEGFQLITNAVEETRNPQRNIPAGIYGSILITTTIYIVLAIVAVGNLTPAEISAAEEYALARVAQPVLGEAGVVLVALAALLATSSAINSTVFGASRMIAQMAEEGMMPNLLARRSLQHVPWVGILLMTFAGLAFTTLGGLEVITAFSSMTFLLVSIGVSLANLRLRASTGCRCWWVILGIILMATTMILLTWYLWETSRETLAAIVGLYVTVFMLQQIYQHLFRRNHGNR